MKLNAKILLLDDEPLVQMVLCSKLERTGALVVQARTCAEAVEMSRNNNFDAAVFDHQLPDGSGLDVVRLLRRDGVGFPVVMLSGDSIDIAHEASDIDGICSVQSKPPNPKAVVEAVALAMGHTVKQEAARVGRYAYWKAVSDKEVPGECAQDEWVAIDLSSLGEKDLHPSVEHCLRQSRSGTVVLGANDSMKNHFKAIGVDIDYVSSVEELAALSRHPTTPSERMAVLQAVRI